MSRMTGHDGKKVVASRKAPGEDVKTMKWEVRVRRGK